MVETDDKTSMAANSAAPDEKQGNSGCLILFLLAMPLVDAIGVMIPLAGPYANVVTVLGFVGFVCGAVLGAYVSVRIKKRHWWSSCRWAIYGLLVACLFAFASIYASIAILKMQ